MAHKGIGGRSPIPFLYDEPDDSTAFGLTADRSWCQPGWWYASTATKLNAPVVASEVAAA